MKTAHSRTHPHEHGPGNLAHGLGNQLAALLLAVLVTPAAFHAGDTHSQPVTPIKRITAPSDRS